MFLDEKIAASVTGEVDTSENQLSWQRFRVDSLEELGLAVGRAIADPSEEGMVIVHANLHSMFNRSRNSSLQTATNPQR
jgi:hypothetical protein